MDDQFTPQTPQPTQTPQTPQPVRVQVSQPAAGQPQPPSTPSRNPAKLTFTILLLILIIAGGLYGVYAWQHSSVTKLNAQVSSLKSQSAAQESKIADLNKQLSVSTKTATKTTGLFNQTAAITKAVKEYKDNADHASTLEVSINGVTASGNAAYGTVSTPGHDGNAVWLAINNSGKWSVVSQGTVGVCKSQAQKYNLPAIWAEDSTAC